MVGTNNRLNDTIGASSSGGNITPLGISKSPMTDRNWNNSELKKFSVQQSKSNADIAEELLRFKEEGRVCLDNED